MAGEEHPVQVANPVSTNMRMWYNGITLSFQVSDASSILVIRSGRKGYAVASKRGIHTHG